MDPDYHTVVAGGFIVQKLYQMLADEALAQVEKIINELGPITEYLKSSSRW